MLESGLISHWWRQSREELAVEELLQKGKARDFYYRDAVATANEGDLKRMGADDFVGLFVSYGLAIALILVTFLIELTFGRMFNRQIPFPMH
jgi:hypothetical protein